jgi:hypothetical protein
LIIFIRFRFPWGLPGKRFDVFRQTQGYADYRSPTYGMPAMIVKIQIAVGGGQPIIDGSPALLIHEGKV